MDFQKHALILAMIETLKRQGNRTGKTHIIKGLFLAQAARLVDVPFEFFLYKHGPYSTDIEENIEQMKSYGATEVETDFEGYGVHLSAGGMAEFTKQQARIPEHTQQALQRVCQFLHHRNVNHLERLATAAWIRKREGVIDADQVARRLHELKPHISLAEAREAYEQLRLIRS